MRKRLITATVLMIVFCTGLMVRIGWLTFGNAYSVDEGFHSYALTIDTVEPNIYDCNGVRLTNNVANDCVVLRPNEDTFNALSYIVESGDLSDVVEQLQYGKPILYYSKNEVPRIKNVPVYSVTVSSSLFRQFISRESSGLLSCLPEIIGSKKINFSVDAKGRVLDGDKGTVYEDNYHSMEGLKTTLNNNVQSILYDACSSLQSGCAVIADVEKASVLACVSKPDDTYLNKILMPYPVGSVFKIVAAVCALENDVDISYTCNGVCTVGDTTYACYHHKKHGKQNLKTALANSCNCYFVQLALQLGAGRLLDTAGRLGFADATQIYADWVVENASLPSESDLQSKGELALFGFGQGKLTATPIQFCSLLCTLCNDGIRQPLKFVSAKVAANGREEKITYSSGKRATDSDSAQITLSYLRYVVSNGNAGAADYLNESAGKTATAQTGQYRNGEELLTTWFAGIYPYSNPKYAIVIVCENGTGGAADCCPIFRTVVENLENL